MPYKFRFPRIYSMLDGIDPPKDPADFWKTVALELATMMEYASSAQEPEIIISDGHKVGDQYIWEFWVNDLAKRKESSFNWHGQNTSQWLYAGAIVLRDGEVSSQH